jgi:carbohydrate kinase (thermoresistant glucokinase family)
MVYILMGVSGSGKTTIGKMVAKYLNIRFFDADNFHSQSSILKIKNGKVLTDSDRIPWLTLLNKKICERSINSSCILSCSSLKGSYRKILSKNINVFFIFLDGNYELIYQRLLNRKNHFFANELLINQFQILEKPNNCPIISVDQTVEEVCQEILDVIKSNE